MPSTEGEGTGAERARPAAGLILAAGLSRRAGPVDKLVLEVEGEAMVRRVARIALAAGLDPVLAVTGGAGTGAHRVLEDLPLTRVVNPRRDEGIGTSVACGVAALPPEVPAVVVLLGDMPWVRAETVRALVTASRSQPEVVCVPVHEGRRGNPVLWGERYFPTLRELTGDQGARGLLGDPRTPVREVAVDDPGVRRDVDVPTDLDGLR